jgi:hypothetical protein
MRRFYRGAVRGWLPPWSNGSTAARQSQPTTAAVFADLIAVVEDYRTDLLTELATIQRHDPWPESETTGGLRRADKRVIIRATQPQVEVDVTRASRRSYSAGAMAE